MKFHISVFKCFYRIGATAFIAFFLSVMYAEAAGQEITPADNWYLAKAIDDSLVRMYDLKESFDKKLISKSLRPRNVFEKAFDIAEKFNMLHNNAVDRNKLLEFAKVTDINRTKPGDVYEVLSLIKAHLLEKGAFTEYTGEKTSKSPSDVFQMMRQISLHCYEIAKKKGIVTNWATPAQVYEAVATTLLPAVQAIADEAGIKYQDYLFPKQPVSGVVPRYTYKLFYHVYNNISKYYMYKDNYEPVSFTEVNDCDDISPADMFDLAQIIASELKANIGVKSLKSETAARYAAWKSSREEILPGHVFRLIQYNFILSKSILAGE